MLQDSVKDSGQTKRIIKNNAFLLSDTLNLKFNFKKKWITIKVMFIFMKLYKKLRPV